MSTQPSPQDVVPTNGPATYKFTLARLRRTQLSNWPPHDDMILPDAEAFLGNFGISYQRDRYGLHIQFLLTRLPVLPTETISS
jgi:hypothetical protein